MPTKTKGDIAIKAFQWLRISGLTKKPESNETESILELLEGMMYEFDSRNICTSFNFEEVPDASTESGISNEFWLAAAFNLAGRLAPDYGKLLTQDQQKQANQTLSNWSARASHVNPISQPNRQPRGSGNNFRYSSWIRYNRESPRAPISCNTEVITRGAVNDYTLSIVDYLDVGETVSSHTVEVTAGLTLVSESFSAPVLSYRLDCATNAIEFQQVTFEVITSTGRKQTFVVDFKAIGTQTTN